MTFVKNFLKEEAGQDLIEYTLLLAFVALFSTTIYTGLQGKITAVWTYADTTLGATQAGS